MYGRSNKNGNAKGDKPAGRTESLLPKGKSGKKSGGPDSVAATKPHQHTKLK